MERYINVNDITLKGVAVFDENLDLLIPLSDVRKALQLAPTADVVPRGEVARAICCEIEEEIVAALESNYRAKQERVERQETDDFIAYMCEGKIAALRGIEGFVEELKKKYTEGKND